MSKRNRIKFTPTNELEALIADIDLGQPEATDVVVEAVDAEMDLSGIESADVIVDAEVEEIVEVIEPSDMSDDELLAALAEEDAPAAEPEMEASDSDIPAIDIKKLYAEQRSDIVLSDGSDAELIAAANAATAKSERRKPNSETTKPPRINTAGMKKSEALLAKTDVTALTKLGLDDTAINMMVQKIDSLPVKVQDKATNLVKFLSGKESMSNYTRYTIEYLLKEGPLTVPQIVDKLMTDRKYSSGTARSQAQQISTLLRTYDLVSRGEKGVMQLDMSNPLVTHISDRLGLAA